MSDTWITLSNLFDNLRGYKFGACRMDEEKITVVLQFFFVIAIIVAALLWMGRC